VSRVDGGGGKLETKFARNGRREEMFPSREKNNVWGRRGGGVGWFRPGATRKIPQTKALCMGGQPIWSREEKSAALASMKKGKDKYLVEKLDSGILFTVEVGGGEKKKGGEHASGNSVRKKFLGQRSPVFGTPPCRSDKGTA